MSGLILHHYGCSPFSEKIRLVMGLKELSWKSVEIPPVMPKPDLVALTGGYRHTPVLQIGADVFCDTRLIAREIEKRHPQPSLFCAGTHGLASVVEAWAERDLFWPIARYVSGVNAEILDNRFHADRAALRGKAAPTIAQVKAAAERALGLVQSQIPIVEEMLKDGRPYLLGDSPGLADFSVYHGLWFLSAFPIDCSGLLARFSCTLAWMTRIKSIGHGHHRSLDPKGALSIVADSRPESCSRAIANACLPPAGTRIAIRPEGYETAEVTGRVVLASRDRISVLRVTPEYGEVVVHFPRVGYVIEQYQ